MARDLERELLEMGDGWPDAWKPQEGETLVGIIQRYSIAQGLHGPCRTAILRRDDGSRVSIWLNSTVLLAQFEQEKPKIGERIGLRYFGKHPVKGYRRYTLIVDRDNPEPDFSPLGGERADLADADLGDDGPFAGVPNHPCAQARLTPPPPPPQTPEKYRAGCDCH